MGDFAVTGVSGQRSLCRAVRDALGLAETALTVDAFPDGELHVSLAHPVRGRRVFLLQSLDAPVGERLLALALAADAAHRAGAASVTAVIPYLAYARQDRRRAEGDPLGAAVVANLLAACRFERVLAVDLHAAPVEGFFACPVEHLTAEPLIAEALRPLAGPDAVVVAPDLGAAKLARRYARRLGLPVAFVQKTRLGPREVTAEQLVGDVRGRRPIIVDDMISTGVTVAAAIDAVLRAGAKADVIVAATHGVFAPGWQTVLGAGPVRRLLVTDSLEALPGSEDVRLERLSIAPLLSEALRRIDRGAPMGELLSGS